MILFVKLFGQNDRGIPEDFPQCARKPAKGEVAPQGWVEMEEELYEALMAKSHAIVAEITAAEELHQPGSREGHDA